MSNSTFQIERPVILLAFSKGWKEAPLPNIPDEYVIEDYFEKSLAEVISIPDVTTEHILKAFVEYRNQIKIFHYAGHANESSFVLGEDEFTHGESLATYLSHQEGVELVFLNGCLTQNQGEAFLKAGIKSVIVTDRLIRDDLAKDFSRKFYRSLASGVPISQSFKESSSGILTKNQGQTRSFYRDRVTKENKSASDTSFPWVLLPEPDNNWRIPLAPKPKELTTIPKINLEEVIGRYNEIKRVRQTLSQVGDIVSIHGIGGIGKTTLAKAYLQKYQYKYNHIAWIPIDGESIKEAFVTSSEGIALIENLSLSQEIDRLPEKDRVEKGFVMILNKLKKITGRNLLVIDNVTDEIEDDRIKNEIRLGEDWHVLVTSRQKLYNYENIELKELKKEYAKKLYYFHYSTDDTTTDDTTTDDTTTDDTTTDDTTTDDTTTDDTTTDDTTTDDTTLNNILELIDYHTLLIEVSAKQSAKRGHTLSETFHNLKKREYETLKKNNDSDYIHFLRNYNRKEARVYAFLMSIFEVGEFDKKDQQLMIQFAVLPSKYLHIQDNKGENLNSFLKVEKRTEQDNPLGSIKFVEKKGWLQGDQNNNSYKMHRLLQEAIRYKLKPNPESCATLIETFTEKLYVRENKNPLIRAKYTSYVESILSSIKTRSLELIQLTNLYANMLVKLGLFSKAEKFALANESACKEDNLCNQDQLVAIYNTLAVIYQKQGLIKKAMSYMELVEKIFEKGGNQ